MASSAAVETAGASPSLLEGMDYLDALSPLPVPDFSASRPRGGMGTGLVGAGAGASDAFADIAAEDDISAHASSLTPSAPVYTDAALASVHAQLAVEAINDMVGGVMMMALEEEEGTVDEDEVEAEEAAAAAEEEEAEEEVADVVATFSSLDSLAATCSASSSSSSPVVLTSCK